MSTETLIRSCAPTMARLKTGNMFTCGFESKEQMNRELRQLNQRLRQKGLRILPLRWRDGRGLLYLYRPKRLERDLRDPLAQNLLRECGYPSSDANCCLARLMARLRREDDFPHEVGLFLGYPPKDVDGFMHRKEHYKACGLWKVYDDVEGAVRKFERCRHCTEVYLRCYAQGVSLERLAVAE